MAFENNHASGQLRGDINVTPMIDVLLVLLIIFMVIAPVLPHGLSAALPRRGAHAAPTPETAIVVQVIAAPNGAFTLKINQQDVAISQLGTRLSAIFALRPDRVMFVQADGALAFASIARVVDIGKGAGADHIGLLTSKDAL